MENGAGSEDYVVLSGVRPGLKREFEFAFKSQSECGGSVGRTRSRRSTNQYSQNSSNSSCKSSKNSEKNANKTSTSDGSESKDVLIQKPSMGNTLPPLEEKSKTGTDGLKLLVSPENKLEAKSSKNVAVTKTPMRLKELLETGLLQGLPVRYLRGSKAKGTLRTALRGVISGSGISCSCEICGGTKIVTPNQFELHAGSANKRPPENIYLDNDITLRGVMDKCKGVPMDMLEVTIRKSIGCFYENKYTSCQKCKGSIPEAEGGKTMSCCDSCMALEMHQHSPTQLSDRSAMSVSLTSSDKVSSQTKNQGRLTRKDLRMHKLVFKENGLADGTVLGYYVRGQIKLDGEKRSSGIYCNCCCSVVSPSQFEAHAGSASLRNPYFNICTLEGKSLHRLAVKLSKEAQKISADESDDRCDICANGGDLLLCDSCPRAFHTECVSLPSFPKGTWYCKFCRKTFQKEKLLASDADVVTAGRIAGQSTIEQTNKQGIHIVEFPETEVVGGCVLCRSHDFKKSGFGPRTIMLCDQCDREFHVECLKENNMGDLKELPKEKWFCCIGCDRINSCLQHLVDNGEMRLRESRLNVLKKKHEENSPESSAKPDIRWRLLSGKMNSDETMMLQLSKAVGIFNDRFDPIADASSRCLDLIPDMVYGKKLKGHDFHGMYCAVITVDSLMVSAGIIRIFGHEVAELPLVATSSECQGRGYFQLLYSCIQDLLDSLHVRNLVLPASHEAEPIWTKKFGFAKMRDDELKKLQRDYQVSVFQGTSMLHKSLGNSSTSGE